MTPGSGVPRRRDRLGASMIRHPVWTAAALAATFYLLTVAISLATVHWAGLLGLGSGVLVVLVVWAPVSIAYGVVMVTWVRRNPTARSRADADQLGRLRAAVRAARRGRPVDLDPELAGLLARQADHATRMMRRLRLVVPLVGVVIAFLGVIAASLGAWLWAVVIWIAALAATGLVWWVFRREIRLAESLAERG